MSWTRVMYAGVAVMMAVALGSGACGGDGPSDPNGPIDTTNFNLGPAGGTFSDPTGAITLVVPANAVQQNVTVTIASATTFPADQRLVAGAAVSVTLDPNVTFSIAATLTINYSAMTIHANILRATLGLWRVNAAGSAWEAVTSQNNAAAQTVTASLTSFSTFGLLGQRMASIAALSDTILAALVSTPVPQAPSVQVLDTEGGTVEGVDVTFSLTAGGGAIDPATGVVTTDTAGTATLTSWTLGPAVGANTVTATAGEALTGSPVTFTAAGDTAPSAVGFLFASDWSTATGGSDAALRDANKSLPWTSWNSFGATPQLLDVVSATGLGFPAAMANVLRVRQEGVAAAEDLRLGNWDAGQHALPPVAPGNHRYYRVYVRYSEPTSSGGSEDHGIQPAAGVCAFGWAWKVGSSASGIPATWQFGQSSPDAFYALATPLQRDAVYRLEWHMEFVTTTSFRFDTRIYDAAGTLVRTDVDFNNTDLNPGTLEANNPIINVNDATCIRDFFLGNNGQAGWPQPPNDEFRYYGGVCIRDNDWCGPYQVGEGPAAPPRRDDD